MSIPPRVQAQRMAQLAARLASAQAAAQGAQLDHQQIIEYLADAEEFGRMADAHRLFAAGIIAHESRIELGRERLCAQLGSRSPGELIERVTKVPGRTARERMRLAERIATRRSLIGDTLPSHFPNVLDALEVGAIGVDAAKIIVDTIGPAAAHSFDLEAARIAQAELVDAAVGRGSWLAALEGDTDAGEDGTQATMDFTKSGWSQRTGATFLEVSQMARVWALAIDPDGAMPNDELALRQRGITLGTLRNGTVALHGELLPEVAAMLSRVLDVCLNPRVDGPPAPANRPGLDDQHRTPAQRRHDAFAALVSKAAALGDFSKTSSATATLVVTVTPEELQALNGVAEPPPSFGPDAL